MLTNGVNYSENTATEDHFRMYLPETKQTQLDNQTACDDWQ